MAKCESCRKQEAKPNWKEKTAKWFLFHLFPKSIKSERTDAFTQGFETGYKMGREHEREVKPMQQLINEYVPKN